MKGGEYRVTFKSGRIKYAKAKYADSLVLLLGGIVAMLKTVEKIEVKHNNNWIDTNIVNKERIHNPTKYAQWVD